jgi:hypothetical protein
MFEQFSGSREIVKTDKSYAVSLFMQIVRYGLGLQQIAEPG